MDGDREGEGKSGREEFLLFLHQNSTPQLIQIGQGIGGFRTKEVDGAEEHFRVSSSPQMHLNADWFSRLPTHTSQSLLSPAPKLNQRAFVLSPLICLVFIESHHKAHFWLHTCFFFLLELLPHTQNAFSACPFAPH